MLTQEPVPSVNSTVTMGGGGRHRASLPFPATQRRRHGSVFFPQWRGGGDKAISPLRSSASPTALPAESQILPVRSRNFHQLSSPDLPDSGPGITVHKSCSPQVLFLTSPEGSLSLQHPLSSWAPGKSSTVRKGAEDREAGDPDQPRATANGEASSKTAFLADRQEDWRTRLPPVLLGSEEKLWI